MKLPMPSIPKKEGDHDALVMVSPLFRYAMVSLSFTIAIYYNFCLSTMSYSTTTLRTVPSLIFTMFTPFCGAARRVPSSE